MFYNVQREPGNFRHMIRMESSLFRFAKQQGFSTHYVSSQTANLATYVGERYIDHFVTKEDMEVSMATRKDRVLVDALKNIDLSQRNFIVLHQRSSHSPYDQQYPPEFARYPLGGADYVDFTTNSYDNAVSFTDEVVAEIIDHLKAHSQGRTLLVFTADHSELLGEGGKYGHTHLQIETARVPLMVYGKNLGPDVQQRLYGLSQPTHYEIGKEISAILGYRVVNPNEEPGIYYVNGPDIGGRAGYMTIDKRVSPPRSTLIQDMSVNESVCEINAAKPVTVSVDANSLSPFR
jgi:membrane-anchored protein YejM (alkaline phosphatase superfamily)